MRRQTFFNIIATIACLVVAVASFALSYVALRDVSVRLEAVPPMMGWLVPITIDGGIICGSAIIWALSREDRKRPTFPFLFVGALVLMSVTVNIAHAGDSLLAKVIASLPPLILLGTLELVAATGRRVREDGRDTQNVVIDPELVRDVEDVFRPRVNALSTHSSISVPLTKSADSVTKPVEPDEVTVPAVMVKEEKTSSSTSSTNIKSASAAKKPRAATATGQTSVRKKPVTKPNVTTAAAKAIAAEKSPVEKRTVAKKPSTKPATDQDGSSAAPAPITATRRRTVRVSASVPDQA